MIVSTLRKATAIAGRVIDHEDRELMARGAVLAFVAFTAVVFVAFTAGVAMRAFELAGKL